MSLKSVMRAIEIAFGNPLSRAALKHMTGKCPHGYNSKLEHAIAMMVEGSHGGGFCLIDALMLEQLLKVASHVVGGQLEDFLEYVKDPPVRRGIALILKGIAYYGITVPQRLPAPFLIVWNFTNMCNLRCVHCYQRADKPLPDELTLEEKLNVIHQLDDVGVAAIAFSGGEPLIHPHFLKVASEAASRNIYVSIATNGTLLTRELTRKLKEIGVRYVEISLDSIVPENHDRFRGIKGAWEKTVKGIRNAVEAGLTVGIATTITKMNIHEISEMINMARRLRVKRVIFFNFIPVGRGSEIIDYDLSPEEREEALKSMYLEAIGRGCSSSTNFAPCGPPIGSEPFVEVASTAPQFARVAMEMSRGQMVAPTHFVLRADPGLVSLGNFIGGCGAGRIYAAIQPNGDVAPCVFLPITVGNLREKTFKELWENTPLFNKLRNRELLRGVCGTCSYKYVCGGCRARAYSYTGDVLAPDPGCILAKEEYYNIIKALIVKSASSV